VNTAVLYVFCHSYELSVLYGWRVQIISEKNPFVEARFIGLNTIWEDLGKIIRRVSVSYGVYDFLDSVRVDTAHISHSESAQDEKAYRKCFWQTLAPTIFSLPTTEPDIRTTPVQEIYQSTHPEWIVRGLRILNDFDCQDAEDITRYNERARKHMDEGARARLNATARINREEDRQGVDVEGWVKELRELVSNWEREVEGKPGCIRYHLRRYI
jgi:hypothetical protein